jgi:hypothetical protein
MTSPWIFFSSEWKPQESEERFEVTAHLNVEARRNSRERQQHAGDREQEFDGCLAACGRRQKKRGVLHGCTRMLRNLCVDYTNAAVRLDEK